MEECCYAECHLCLSVTNKPFMLSGVMMNVVMLSVAAPYRISSAKNTLVDAIYLLGRKTADSDNKKLFFFQKYFQISFCLL
jgi:hypothetical protein